MDDSTPLSSGGKIRTGLRARSRAECDRLVARLAQKRGLRLALRLRTDDDRTLPPTAAPRGATKTADPASPRPVSIWQPRILGDDLVFERPEPLPLGDHYATRRRLTASKTRRRICFFGESAAAGYLYAPHLTPAGILERQLCTVEGDDTFEVIDLARTNERIDSLVETVERSLQLDPDLFVIFAGNNWNLLETPEISPYFPSVEARVRYARLLRKDGLSGPIDRAGLSQLEKGAAALDTIADIARSRSIPVVVVIPEINLADWETLQPCSWLPGDDTARWYAQLESSRGLLAAGRFAEAAVPAHAMLDLDSGLCPTSYRLLASAWAGLGHPTEAAEACRAEVAAASYATLCFLGAPQATPAVQELLRRTASRHGFAPVDLPRLFAEHTGSPLPGRRLFLDYCHLTVEGMKLAMAATTAEVVRLTSGRKLEPLRLVDDLPDPEITSHADATAKLGAAIHSAHRLLPVGPKAPILEHWCQEAMAAEPAIADTMLDLIAARCSPLPAVLTSAQTRNFRSPFRLGLQHGWRYDFLDADLIEALVAALDHHGRQAGAEIDRHLLESGGPARQPLDLISAGQLREPLARIFPEVMDGDGARCAFHRSPWPESRFWFASERTHDVSVELRARLPSVPTPTHGSRTAASAVVEVNGRPVARLELGPRWRNQALRVDRRFLRHGLNEATVRWPMPTQPGEEGMEAAVQNLELGRKADLHPIFGEIFSLRVATSA